MSGKFCILRLNFKNMKIKNFLFIPVFLMLFAISGQAQEVKIGYTNIELVLLQMPKAKQVEAALATFEQKLTEQLQIKQNYARQRLTEYMEKKEKNQISPEEDQAFQKELGDLDKEIQEFAAESEQKLLAKREELLVPVLDDLQNAIDAVAERKGYKYVLNQTMSSGVSTILYGPEEDDLTEDIMKELGIALPSNN